MNGDKVIEEKENVGNTVKFSDLTNLEAGVNNYIIKDVKTNKKYNVSVNVKADTYNQKMLYSVKYGDKDTLIIDENNSISIILVVKILLFIDFAILLAIVFLILLKIIKKH